MDERQRGQRRAVGEEEEGEDEEEEEEGEEGRKANH